MRWVAVTAVGTALLLVAIVRDVRHQVRYARLVERLRRTEFDPHHAGCQAVIGTLSSAVRSQQAYIDALEQAGDLGDQAEQFLREAGS